MSEKDIGILLASVKFLKEEMAELRNEVSELRHGQQKLLNNLSRGKGVLLGLMLAVGSVSAGLSEFVDKWWRWIK